MKSLNCFLPLPHLFLSFRASKRIFISLLQFWHFINSYLYITFQYGMRKILLLHAYVVAWNCLQLTSDMFLLFKLFFVSLCVFIWFISIAMHSSSLLFYCNISLPIYPTKYSLILPIIVFISGSLICVLKYSIFLLKFLNAERAIITTVSICFLILPTF